MKKKIFVVLLVCFGCGEMSTETDSDGDNFTPILDLYCKNLVACYHNKINYDDCMKGMFDQIELFNDNKSCINSMLDYQACMNEQNNICNKTSACDFCSNEMNNYSFDCYGNKKPCPP